MYEFVADIWALLGSRTIKITSVIYELRKVFIMSGGDFTEIFEADYVRIADSLRECSKKCSQMEAGIRSLTDAVQNLDIFWNGDANTMFITNLNEDIACIEVFLAKVRQFVRDGMDALEQYQENEKVIEQIVTGINLLKV